MAKIVILNKDLIRSQRSKRKLLGNGKWMHSGRFWNTIDEFMRYSGYSLFKVYSLEKQGIITLKDWK